MDLIISFLRLAKHSFIFSLTCIKVFFIHNFYKKKKIIFILSTPRHENLGDHAIVYSQYKLFEDLGYGKNIVEVSSTTYEYFKEKIAKISNNTDLIIIDGGGNIGTLWIEAEYVMRDIINRFNKNPVVIMPQTAFFEDSPIGKSEFQKSIEIYCGHSDLTIFCRDSDTYNLISKNFDGVKSFYVPDMVMFLSDISQNLNRNGAMLCMREDLEKTCSDKTKKDIVNHLNAKGINVSKCSTIAEKRVEMWQRKKVLLKKWEEFSKAEFVVTDRLHGMIFSAITSTPCLAIDNISHKVKNGYKWLEHLPYINYCDNVDSITDRLDNIIELSEKRYCYDSLEIRECYELLKNLIEQKL